MVKFSDYMKNKVYKNIYGYNDWRLYISFIIEKK